MAGGFDGVLLDLGVSSPQLDNAARGFSFAQDGPLDMRMNNASGMTAADWLTRAPEHEIARVIREYGEERFAKRIARAIVHARSAAADRPHVATRRDRCGAVPMREPGKHPATRTFQAIRIHVNQEFDEIEAALDGSLLALAPQGRLCAISFHSLEDGIVKRFIQKHSQEDPVYAGLPVVPGACAAEVASHRQGDSSVARPKSSAIRVRAARSCASPKRWPHELAQPLVDAGALVPAARVCSRRWSGAATKRAACSFSCRVCIRSATVSISNGVS